MEKFNSIEDCIKDIALGKAIIVTDDENRENEGDIIVSAEKITPELVNFMAKHARGLICTPISPKIAKKLGLDSMVKNNREALNTDFKVSVDAYKGITTGISAKDRAKTIKIMANPKAKSTDLVQPGHIFPLGAVNGGVLRRAGHTEAAVDFAKLANLQPAGVICEIMNDNGEMARLPELLKFAKKFNLKICSIKDLIKFRSQKEKIVKREETINLPTKWGEFKLSLFRSKIDDKVHLAIHKGKINDGNPVLTRVHSSCVTGDIFHSQRCDCGEQLDSAMAQIENEKRGLLVYMNQEGRGIGLTAKINAYKLQEKGYDTVTANQKLGYPSDLRDYGIGAQIIRDLGIKKIILMTNNPKKVVGLNGHGLEIHKQIPIIHPPNKHNFNYLKTKKEKMGHTL